MSTNSGISYFINQFCVFIICQSYLIAMQLPIWQPFINEWYTFALFVLLIFIVIGISELAQSMLRWNYEFTRKLVHLFVGTIVSTCPLIFKSNIVPIFLASIFIFINALALKTDKFKGIHSTDRFSYGTVYFPIAFLIPVS